MLTAMPKAYCPTISALPSRASTALTGSIGRNLGSSISSSVCSASDRRSVEVMRETGPFAALLYEAGARTNGKPVWIIDLSLGGARFRADTPQSPGSQVTLELRDHSVRLDGAISRVRGLEAAMVFRPDPRSDPAFSRLLRSDFPMEHPVRV